MALSILFAPLVLLLMPSPPSPVAQHHARAIIVVSQIAIVYATNEELGLPEKQASGPRCGSG